MPEEGARSSLGWRILAVGSLFLLALALFLMSYVFLPEISGASVGGGVTGVALATAAGIRENVAIVAVAFLVLAGVTGFGYADKLLKPITWGALAVLAFYGLAAWWTLRTIPARNLLG
ncbi:MAG TPA: hypothetical protein VFC90_08140 [Planctomycetota bacterium]|nr:hypothetical protein [Planctomycetota bacterium]